jgi:hypothetical protein
MKNIGCISKTTAFKHIVMYLVIYFARNYIVIAYSIWLIVYIGRKSMREREKERERGI